jgi:hypothetical protein
MKQLPMSFRGERTERQRRNWLIVLRNAEVREPSARVIAPFAGTVTIRAVDGDRPSAVRCAGIVTSV